MLALIPLLSAVALAWEPGDLRSVLVPSAPAAVTVVQVDGRQLLLGTGGDTTWLVDPQTGDVVSEVSPGGTGLSVVAGRGGTQQVLICEPYGIHHVVLEHGQLGSATRLVNERCSDLAAFTRRNDLGDTEQWLVTAEDVLGMWKLVPGPALEGPTRFGTALTGAPLLASSGDRFAATSVGSSEIVERSGFGRSTLATSGAVGGLALGDDVWAWLLPEVGALEDATRRVVELADEPSALSGGDLDGDGRRDLLLAHPGLLGIVEAGAGEERTFPIPMAPAMLRAADFDGDGCAEVIVAQAGIPVLGVLAGRCTAPEVGEALGGVEPEAAAESEPAPVVVEPEPVRTVKLGTKPEPVLAVRVGETVRLQLALEGGKPSTFEARGGPKHLVIGADGAVDFTAEPADIGSWRVTVRMSGGTELVRTEALWVEVSAGSRPDLSGVAPGPAPEVAPTYDAFGRPTTPLRNESGPYRRSPMALSMCSLGLGAAVGVSGAANSWEFVGQTVLTRTSPALTVDCSGGGDKAHWLLGWDTAPNIVLVWGPDPRGAHIFGITAGVWWGTPNLQIGPYVTMGANLLGAGGRLAWLPIETARRGRHGLQLRATYFIPSAPAGSALLLYTWQIGSNP